MNKNKNPLATFDQLEAKIQQAHQKTQTALVQAPATDETDDRKSKAEMMSETTQLPQTIMTVKDPRATSSATALVMMSAFDKQRFTRIAKEHSLSLSALIRLAVNEYLINHEWK